MPDPSERPDDEDHVVLRVPADPGYARVVRVATSAYAVRLGLAPASIEDLRLAVDEALILLLGITEATATDPASDPASDPATEAHVVVTLDAADDRPPLTVQLRLDPRPPPGPRDPSALGRFRELIPAAVSVEEVDPGAGRVSLRHQR